MGYMGGNVKILPNYMYIIIFKDSNICYGNLTIIGLAQRVRESVYWGNEPVQDSERMSLLTNGH